MAEAKTKRTRRPRGSIDADMILRGAFEVAARDGLDGMSMPGLATHLNVGVTSIYWYYRNKGDLLAQMHATSARRLNERLIRAKDFEPAQWREYLARLFEQLRAAYADDDVLAELMLNRHEGHSGEATLGAYTLVEEQLAYLVSAGFELTEAWRVYGTLWTYTNQVAYMERAKRRTQFPPDGEAQLGLLDVPAMPLLARLIVEDGASLDFAGPASFRSGLELILDAAQARLQGPANTVG